LTDTNCVKHTSEPAPPAVCWLLQCPCVLAVGAKHTHLEVNCVYLDLAA